MPRITPQIPEGLIDLMKGFAKGVIKEKPDNIYEYATVYFEKLLCERDSHLHKGYELFEATNDVFDAALQFDYSFIRPQKGTKSTAMTKDSQGRQNSPELKNSVQQKPPMSRLNSKKDLEPLLAIKEEDEDVHRDEEERKAKAALIIQRSFRIYLRKLKQEQSVVVTEGEPVQGISEETAAIVIQRTFRYLFGTNGKKRKSQPADRILIEEDEPPANPEGDPDKELDQVMSSSVDVDPHSKVEEGTLEGLEDAKEETDAQVERRGHVEDEENDKITSTHSNEKDEKDEGSNDEGASAGEENSPEKSIKKEDIQDNVEVAETKEELSLTTKVEPEENILAENVEVRPQELKQLNAQEITITETEKVDDVVSAHEREKRSLSNSKESEKEEEQLVEESSKDEDMATRTAEDNRREETIVQVDQKSQDIADGNNNVEMDRKVNENQEKAEQEGQVDSEMKSKVKEVNDVEKEKVEDDKDEGTDKIENGNKNSENEEKAIQKRDDDKQDVMEKVTSGDKLAPADVKEEVKIAANINGENDAALMKEDDIKESTNEGTTDGVKPLEIELTGKENGNVETVEKDVTTIEEEDDEIENVNEEMKEENKTNERINEEERNQENNEQHIKNEENTTEQEEVDDNVKSSDDVKEEDAKEVTKKEHPVKIEESQEVAEEDVREKEKELKEDFENFTEIEGKEKKGENLIDVVTTSTKEEEHHEEVKEEVIAKEEIKIDEESSTKMDNNSAKESPRMEKQPSASSSNDVIENKKDETPAKDQTSEKKMEENQEIPTSIGSTEDETYKEENTLSQGSTEKGIKEMLKRTIEEEADEAMDSLDGTLPEKNEAEEQIENTESEKKEEIKESKDVEEEDDKLAKEKGNSLERDERVLRGEVSDKPDIVNDANEEVESHEDLNNKEVEENENNYEEKSEENHLSSENGTKVVEEEVKEIAKIVEEAEIGEIEKKEEEKSKNGEEKNLLADVNDTEEQKVATTTDYSSEDVEIEKPFVARKYSLTGESLPEVESAESAYGSSSPISRDLKDLEIIEGIDITKFGEDSLEAMYYSLRKNEIMLDRMQKIASERKGSLKEHVEKEDKSVTDEQEKDAEVETKEGELSSKETTDQRTPFVEKSTDPVENQSTAVTSNSDKEAPEQEAIVEPLKEIPDEDPIKEMSQEINRKIMACSLSESDSDMCEVAEETLNAIQNDMNISTALEDMTSSETDSTIVTAVTKIQAGARGFLTRRRLRRASEGYSGQSEKKASFGNDAITESLEALEEQEAAVTIQKSFRNYQNRKYHSTGEASHKVGDFLMASKDDSDERVQGITEINLTQKEEPHETSSIDLENEPERLNSLKLAARRSTLQRGDAVVRNDSNQEDEEAGDKKPSTEEENTGWRSGRGRIKVLGFRQRSMPVQVDFSVLRILPKHMRKRIRSAEMKGEQQDDDNVE